jgi:CubicO group peptidase (beta-lactamase class C family)
MAATSTGATSASGFADARATDPATLGWMLGTPPPADRQVRFDDGSFRRFPQTRWSFSHWRELVPTANISRGSAPSSPLPRNERPELDAVSFVPLGATRSMTWAESLEANYTDGIIVLHHGAVVYERYFGALAADRPHIAFSVTKSLVGTLAGLLLAEGLLDPHAAVAGYIPELGGSGFADATVAQVLDMTTALAFSEDYDAPDSDMMRWRRAYGGMPRPDGDHGPRSDYEYLATIGRAGGHGQAFTYRSVNTSVLGWLIARATGRRAHELLEERLWRPLGAEGDAYIQVDPTGTPIVSGGLNLRLRDLARFGEMMRQDGYCNGRQVVPAAVVAAIRRGGSRAAFSAAGYSSLPGWSYHHQWWMSHNSHGAFAARGIHGQAIYVDPTAGMVIARFASHPHAANAGIDPTSLPAYAAIAAHLAARPAGDGSYGR